MPRAGQNLYIIRCNIVTVFTDLKNVQYLHFVSIIEVWESEVIHAESSEEENRGGRVGRNYCFLRRLYYRSPYYVFRWKTL